MPDWLIHLLGGRTEAEYKQIEDAASYYRFEWERQQKKTNEVEQQVNEKDDALKYLARRFAIEMGEYPADDCKMWMPQGVTCGVEVRDGPIEENDIPVMTAHFDSHFAYNLYLNGIDTTGYATAAVEKMAKSIARAVEYKLTGDGMTVLSKYLQEKDKKHAA